MPNYQIDFTGLSVNVQQLVTRKLGWRSVRFVPGETLQFETKLERDQMLEALAPLVADVLKTVTTEASAPPRPERRTFR